MAGTTKYDWYPIFEELAEHVEEGASTIMELSEVAKVPYATLRNALKREFGITAKSLHNLPEMVEEMEGPEELHAKRPERAVEEEDPFEHVKYKFGEDGSKTIEKLILLTEAEKDDPRAIMEKMGLDPIKWELLSCELEYRGWQTSMKLSQGSDEHGNKLPEETKQQNNYAFHCKVRVRPFQSTLDRAQIQAVFDELEPPELSPVRRNGHKSTLMLEAGIYDPHFGKQAWEDETGEVNYDLDIAERDFRAAIEGLLARIRTYGLTFEKVIFPVGQDFFHIDTTQETTTGGTKVDTDDRWQKIFQVGVNCLVWAIEELRQLAPVDVMYVPGNHDEMLSYFACSLLEAYFRNADDVTVDVAPTRRKYVRYGINLIGFSHGRDEGKRIEKLMQVEAPEDWGETKIREFHLGDLHHEEVKEAGGIIFRRISAITATDAWHAEKGYKGAVRKAQAFVWDKERGLETVLNVGVS